MSAPSTSTASHARVTPSSNQEGATMTIRTTETSAPATALGAGLLPLPPSLITPAPPQGYEPTTGDNFRGVKPWAAELVLLPKAVEDLARFASEYASVLGSSAPPIAHVVVALTVAGQWSTERAASAAWDGYCRDQEGSAWLLINGIMERLRPAFALAVKADPSIGSTYPSLRELIEVRKVSALKGVSTRQRNKKALAEGKPATHGAAGRARQKRAAKAALAAAISEVPKATAP